jgi:RimJ/RimL family protein N-acetyltransferase
MILATARLTLRLLTPADAPFILELVNQPSWLRNIGDRNVHSDEDAVGYIRNGPMASYAKHGFGLWCVERKEDRIPIGLCGLLKREYLEESDIGFAYLERFQGMGYGMEAATATLAHAREALGLAAVAAVVNPTNAGSIRILEKLGMTYRRPILMPGETEPIALYQVG